MDKPIEICKIKDRFENGRYIEGKTLKIFTHPDPFNPRIEFDNLGHMICFHRRYDLGDHTVLKSDQFTSWQDLKDHLINVLGAVVILPIFMYDHSGITISTTPFNDRWDSMQIGYIYVSKEDVIKEYGTGDLTPELKETITNVLRSEVSEYNCYLTGDIYGYQLQDPAGKIIDACWGYFGSEGIKLIKKECGVD